MMRSAFDDSSEDPPLRPTPLPTLSSYHSPPSAAQPPLTPAAAVVLSACVRSEEAAKKAAASASSNAKNGKAQASTAAPDADPFGEALLSREPLVEATRFLAFLQLHSPDALETQQLAVEVQLRKGRALLAWKALKRLHSLEPSDAERHFGLCRWVEALQDAGEPALPPLLRQVLEEEVAGGRLRGAHPKRQRRPTQRRPPPPPLRLAGPPLRRSALPCTSLPLPLHCPAPALTRPTRRGVGAATMTANPLLSLPLSRPPLPSQPTPAPTPTFHACVTTPAARLTGRLDGCPPFVSAQSPAAAACAQVEGRGRRRHCAC